MRLPKQLWTANYYAISFCPELSRRILKRRLYRGRSGAKWAAFYDAKTNSKVFDCNRIFAETHFSKHKDV